MALTRRSTNRVSGSIWPGFVDAMTALLLVLMFVLTIFMVVQFMLRETISGQESELDALSEEVNSLAQALGFEQQRAFQLEEQVSSLGVTLEDAQSQVATQSALIAQLNAQSDLQTAELETQRAAISSFEAQVASLLSERDEAIAVGEALDAERSRLIDEQEALNLALASARDEVDEQAEAARLAAARREALSAMVADLQSQAEENDASLAAMLAQLQDSETQATDLGARLADTKAQLAAEEAERLAELAAAEALRERLSDAEQALSAEDAARLAEAAAAEALRQKLVNSESELTAMTLALEEQRQEAEDTLTILAAANAVEDDLAAQLAALQAASSDGSDALLETQNALAAALAAKLRAEQSAETTMTESEQRAVLLATANSALSDEQARSAEGQRQVALLNEQVSSLRAQLGSLQALLDQASSLDAQSRVRIETLGSDLNTALARVAAEQKRRAELEAAERERLEAEALALQADASTLQAEALQLERYRSEFFGRLREVLGDREGVQIVGDRFVFSSEVLFGSASANLEQGGKDQIERVAGLLTEVSGSIPSDIDWVIRVDGHTDSTPLSGTGRYRDNWELSQARALSVVRFMTDELGFPATRLAATGFGEFQPVSDGDSPEDLARNRRIELKLTER